VWKKILDFVFPRQCVFCGKINPQGKYEFVCPDCIPTIRLLDGARCTVCSEPVGPGDMPNIHGCPKCAAHNYAFGQTLCLCAFDGAPREMVHELKYRRGVHILRDIAKIAKDFPRLEEYLKGAVLAPVPLHHFRALRRKYNQSELIAKTLADTFPNAGISVKPLLRRTRSTPTQTTLDRHKREANVKGAFSFRAVKVNAALSRDTRIIIVDDVMTSGSTLSECARILKKEGFKNIDAFAFAKRL